MNDDQHDDQHRDNDAVDATDAPRRVDADADASAGANVPANTQSLFGRIGSWFKRGNGNGGNGAGPASGAIHGQVIDPHAPPSGAIETRSSFLRPWARRDAAIHQLQDGFVALTELMGSVRDNLEKSAARQEELVRYLSHLPEALQSLPESNRMHGEALRAIHTQLAHQNAQQERLADILEKINTKGLQDREVLDEVRERVETMRQTDEAIAHNLNSVGAAMQTISKNGATSTQVLEQMRDNIDHRDGQLERILHKQGTRFTTMLAVAIFLSIAALVAVGVVGWMLLQAKR